MKKTEQEASKRRKKNMIQYTIIFSFQCIEKQTTKIIMVNAAYENEYCVRQVAKWKQDK